MYGHRHIDVYKLARSCIDICVWKEETENYDRIIFSLAATECLLLLSLEHLVGLLLCQIQPYPSPLQGSLHFLLYTHLGSHLPVLPPSLLFCHSTLCPTYVHSPATLLLKPFSMLLSCLEIQLALESKSHPDPTRPARADPSNKKCCTSSLRAASAYVGRFQGDLCCLFRPEILNV